MNINKNSKLVIQEIKKRFEKAPDLYIKKMKIKKNSIYLIYIESLTDSKYINDFILEYLSYEVEPTNDLFNYLYSNIPTSKNEIVNNFEELILLLLSGFTIILIDGFDSCLAIETKEKISSDIVEAANERTIKGPKDSFVENYQLNLGLIRKRLKTEKLKINETAVGNLSKNKVGVLYFEENKDIAHIIFKRIKSINVDSIQDVSELIELISSNEKNVFPNYMQSERPDFAALHLLNNKIVIVLENTPFVAIVPIVFTDFFHSPEDNYNRVYNATANRIIRFIALIFTLTLPAIYIAVTTYNQEAIPLALIINFSIQREGVPFLATVEALLMIITFAILRESDVRSPTSIGSSISIVGALVLGDAAVTAGIVSPIMVIIIGMTAISGLLINYIDVSFAIRLWRVVFLIGASVAGFIGIVVVSFLFIANLTSINSFGTPFLTGTAPLIPKDIGSNIIVTFKNKFLKRK